jgi:hypothetical protein
MPPGMKQGLTMFSMQLNVLALEITRMYGVQVPEPAEPSPRRARDRVERIAHETMKIDYSRQKNANKQ